MEHESSLASSFLELWLLWEEIEKQLEEQAMEVDLKEKSVMERLREVEEREMKVGLLEKEIKVKLSLESSFMRLVLKKEKEEIMEELEEKEKEIEWLYKLNDEKEKEFDLKERETIERRRKEAEVMEVSLKQLEAREKELKSLDEALKEKEEILKSKAEEIETKNKSLELKEKELEEMEKEVEGRSIQGKTSKRPRVEMSTVTEQFRSQRCRKSKRSQQQQQYQAAERRNCRPFSVAEVEALVLAVEQLGTRRWRDVKLCAFEDADHRTNVDLKDKWKTLVHTAKIPPQQRRGEAVPQEILNRVLKAHGYWLQQQNMN